MKYAQPYLQSNNTPIPFDHTNKFPRADNYKYMSVRTHVYFRPGPRDDLISFGYMLIYLLIGSTKCDYVEQLSGEKLYTEWLKCKLSTTAEVRIFKTNFVALFSL